jgi:hypothetical protein
VSIKKKFATAVATAGLLAGLFGSAFVPVAKGAANVWDVSAATGATLTAGAFYDMDGVGGFDAGTSKTSADGAGTATYPYFFFASDSNDGAEDGLEITAGTILVTAADVEDSNGDALVGAVIVEATATNGLIVDALSASATACSTDSEDYAASDSSVVTAGFKICVAPNADDLDATGTVTIEVNGVSAAPVYIRSVGPATGITLTKTFSYIANDIQDDADSAFTYVYKNASTADLRDVFGSAGTVGISEADVESVLADLDVIIDGTAANLVAATGLVDDGASALDLESDTDASGAVASADTPLCDSATEDIGDTVTVRVFGDVDGDNRLDSGEISSNTVSVVCTDDGADAVITGIAFAESSVVLGADVDMTATIVDGHGNPLGYLGDGNEVDFGAVVETSAPTALNTTTGAAITGSVGTTNMDGAFVVVDGVGYSTYTTAAGTTAFEYTASATHTGRQYVNLEFPDSDLAAATDVADDFTANILVTSVASGGTAGGTVVIAAGAKLKKATITISAAAGKLVTVTIEKVSTGKTFTYYRKANASGVAKFTIRRAGTWEVFASYGDLVTDTGRLQK